MAQDKRPPHLDTNVSRALDAILAKYIRLRCRDRSSVNYWIRRQNHDLQF